MNVNAWRYPFALLGIAFALVAYALWPRPHMIPVLVYHEIAPSTRPTDSYTVESGLLEQELAYLQTNGYTSLNFVSAVTLMKKGALPKKPIILTFDDALPGQSSLALPLLKTHRTNATFFVTSSLLGDSAHMSWSDVLTISAAGMEIGGHSKTHAHLPTVSASQLTDEVTGDKTAIENEIGKKITVFAYPYGEHNAAIDALVATSGYLIARVSSPQNIVQSHGLTVFGATVMTNSFDAFLKAL